ncbi:MAG: hypothetical protein SOX97_07465 [Sutterella sp.]|nr:hypothetical protein [Sutterella sp.]
MYRRAIRAAAAFSAALIAAGAFAAPVNPVGRWEGFALTPKGKSASVDLVVEDNTTFIFVQNSVRPRLEAGFWAVDGDRLKLVTEKGAPVAEFRFAENNIIEQLVNGEPAKAADPNCCRLKLRTEN